jgi:hypothetical protein
MNLAIATPSPIAIAAFFTASCSSFAASPPRNRNSLRGGSKAIVIYTE